MKNQPQSTKIVETNKNNPRSYQEYAGKAGDIKDLGDVFSMMKVEVEYDPTDYGAHPDSSVKEIYYFLPEEIFAVEAEMNLLKKDFGVIGVYFKGRQQVYIIEGNEGDEE